jgi:adenylate kinase
MKRVLRLVVLGGPGSGKGTQGQAISKLLGLRHISTGEIFRDHIQRKTELGLKAGAYIAQGKLVPDQMATQLLEHLLADPALRKGFILDGYPRSRHQAQDLEKLLQAQSHHLDAVIYLHVSDEEILRRLGGRLVCHACNHSYHLVFQPPARETLCDQCGQPLTHREDDNPDTIRQRIRIFHEMNEPLIQFYRERNLLTIIPAEGLPEEVSHQVQLVASALAKNN